MVAGNTRQVAREESACRKEMAYTTDGKSTGAPGFQCSRGWTDTIQVESADVRGTTRECGKQDGEGRVGQHTNRPPTKSATNMLKEMDQRRVESLG